MSDLRVRAAYADLGGLADFLSWSSGRALPTDVASFLHESPYVVIDVWMHVLEKGGQSLPMWDVQRRALHPPGTPVV